MNEDNLLNVFVTNRFTTIQNFRLGIVQNSKTFLILLQLWSIKLIKSESNL